MIGINDKGCSSDHHEVGAVVTRRRSVVGTCAPRKRVSYDKNTRFTLTKNKNDSTGQIETKITHVTFPNLKL